MAVGGPRAAAITAGDRWLDIGSPTASQMASFRRGLNEQGLAEGRNFVIETRLSPTEEYDRLLALASELVRLPVAVLYVGGSSGVALAARAATSTIPIVFANGSDPVKVGLVASLKSPGGNAAGVSFYTSELVPKRLELLRELVPRRKRSRSWSTRPIRWQKATPITWRPRRAASGNRSPC